MKKFLILIISILLIFTTVFAIGCKGAKDDFNENVDIAHDDLGVKPDAQATEGITSIDANEIKATSQELSNSTEVKQTAAYLFNLANDNLETVNYYANYASGSGVASITNLKMAGSMQVREVRIKDGKSMYMVTMGRVVEGYKTGSTNENIDWITSACRMLLDYGNRKYTPDGQTFYLQSGKSGALTEKALDNFYTENPFIDWSKCDKVKQVTNEQFMKEEFYRNHYAETSSALITADTIESAKVIYNEEKGLYELEIKVDVTTNALELATASTRKSASSDDIEFKYQTIKCEIWDCGLFRMYSTADSWEGSIKAAIFTLNGYSENTWEKYFTYNKQNAPAYQIPAESELSWAK